MKLIDDTKLAKTINRIIDDINSLDKYYIDYGPVQLELPKRFLYRGLDKQKFWEAEDVADVLANYKLISETLKISEEDQFLDKSDLDNMQKSISDFVNNPNTTKADLRKYRKSVQEFKRAVYAFKNEIRLPMNSMNYNYVMLDNVSLGDFELKKNPHWDYCELTIKDGFKNKIDGVVYYDKKVRTSNKILENELMMAKSYPDHSTTFDIMFQAIPTNEYIPLINTSDMDIIYHDPKLNILRITKSNGTHEKVSPIDVRSVVPKYS